MQRWSRGRGAGRTRCCRGLARPCDCSDVPRQDAVVAPERAAWLVGTRMGGGGVVVRAVGLTVGRTLFFTHVRAPDDRPSDGDE